jgi:SAM-dependent methyltransferase
MATDSDTQARTCGCRTRGSALNDDSQNVLKHDTVRAQVRKRYAGIAKAGGGCGCAKSGCCTPDPLGQPAASARLGYSQSDLAAVPDGANLGLGCGNPRAIAALQPGEVVLDLGSGGGFDCFLAARQVGPTGRVIGVDMTPEMVSKARANAAKGGSTNVEFRLGEIEHLPVADRSVDVILSNCVVNLSPDKAQVYREAFRVLRAGGRLAISDVVAVKPLPPAVRSSLDALCGCVAGAARVPELEEMLRAVGFCDVRIRVNKQSRAFIKDWFPGSGVEAFVASADIEAHKPVAARKRRRTVAA